MIDGYTGMEWMMDILGVLRVYRIVSLLFLVIQRFLLLLQQIIIVMRWDSTVVVRNNMLQHDSIIKSDQNLVT